MKNKILFLMLMLVVFTTSVFSANIEILNPLPNELFCDSFIEIQARYVYTNESRQFPFDYYIYTSTMQEVFYHPYNYETDSLVPELYGHINTTLTDGSYIAYVYDGAGMYGSEYVPFIINSTLLCDDDDDNNLITSEGGDLKMLLSMPSMFYGMPSVSNVLIYADYNITTSNLYCNYVLNNSEKVIVNYYKNNVSDKYVYFPFENNKTNMLKDFSGNNRNLYNTTFYNFSENGGYDGYASYSGLGGLKINSTLNVTEFTISVWVKPKTLPPTCDDTKPYNFQSNNGINIAFEYADWDCDNNFIYNAFDIGWGSYGEVDIMYNTINVYNKFDFVWKKGEYIKVYMNGILNGTDDTVIYNNTLFFNSTSMFIGCRNPDCGKKYNGFIDELTIYTDALSEENILSNYNNENILFSNNSVGIYKCSVIAFTNDTYSLETFSNNINITNYYTPLITLNYPLNNSVNYNYNGNISISVISVSTYVCNINDTRYIKINENIFRNSSIKNVAQSVYFNINCTDVFGSSLENFNFITYPIQYGNVIIDNISTQTLQRTLNDINVVAYVNNLNNITNMTTKLYRHLGGSWSLYKQLTVNGNETNITFTNNVDGQYKYVVTAKDVYGYSYSVTSDIFWILLARQINEVGENLTDSQIKILGLLIFMWLGVLALGFYFGQKPFIMLGLLLGVILGIIMFTWLYWWVGLAVILINISTMFFSFKK